MAASISPSDASSGFSTSARRGAITVDGQRYAMDTRDVLYVGRGSKSIVFESDDATRPARFYIVSYPAHASHPTTHIAARRRQTPTELGTAERANRRRLAKYIHPGGVQSAQLVMGVTELDAGQRVEHDAVAHACAAHRGLSVLRSAERRDRRAPDGRADGDAAPRSCATRRSCSRRRGRSTRAAARATTRSAGRWAARIRTSPTCKPSTWENIK